MNMNLKKEPIKRIGSDTFAINFNKADQLDIKLYQDNSVPITSSSIALSVDGTLYLNTKHKDYSKMKKVYEIFDSASSENLIKIYKMYDTKYPDVRKPEDIDSIGGMAKGDAIVKILLKYELLRREYISAKVKPLLSLLFHGERD